MASVEISIAFEWVENGAVSIDERGKLSFPCLPPRPGIYQFRTMNSDQLVVYIGETDRLNRRLQHYRTPGPTQLTNIRLNRILLDTLSSGIGVSILTVMDGIIAKHGELVRTIDLSKKPDRVLMEQAAIIDATECGAQCLNA